MSVSASPDGARGKRRKVAPVKAADGSWRCGAHPDGAKGPCMQWPTPGGNGRCSVHGGKSLRGVASPTFKHGRRSQAGNLPARMVADFQASVNDPDQLLHTRAIARAESRIEDLLAGADHGESGELWKALGMAAVANQKKVDALLTALGAAPPSGDADAVKLAEEAARDAHAAAENLTALAMEGGNDWLTWQEIQRWEDTLKKLREAETTRRTAAVKLLTIDQVSTVVGGVISILRARLSDDAMRKALEPNGGGARGLLSTISEDIRNLMQRKRETVEVPISEAGLPAPVPSRASPGNLSARIPATGA